SRVVTLSDSEGKRQSNAGYFLKILRVWLLYYSFQIRRDLPERFQVSIFLHVARVTRLGGFNRSYHQVSGGVFNGNKFSDVRAITHDLQNAGAERVGENIAHALEENSMLKDGRQLTWHVDACHLLL